MIEHTHTHTHTLSREQADLGTGVRSEKHPKSILGRRYSEEDPRAGLGGPGGCVQMMGALRSPNLDFLQGEPAPPPGAPPGEGPHLSHVLQQADVDGDQAREALVGKTQAFHKEQQLCRAARVLDHVVELPPAQDVDVTLAEKGVWRKKDPGQAPLPQPTVGRARR